LQPIRAAAHQRPVLVAPVLGQPFPTGQVARYKFAPGRICAVNGPGGPQQQEAGQANREGGATHECPPEKRNRGEGRQECPPGAAGGSAAVGSSAGGGLGTWVAHSSSCNTSRAAARSCGRLKPSCFCNRSNSFVSSCLSGARGSGASSPNNSPARLA